MKAPMHLWIIGILALVWSGIEAYGFVMISLANEAYLAGLSAEQLAYLEDMPAWVNVFLALEDFAGLAGALLLLLRSRFAGLAFAFSFMGIVANLFYGLFMAKPSMMDIGGSVAVIFTVSLVLVTLFFWAYSRRLTRIGILS